MSKSQHHPKTGLQLSHAEQAEKILQGNFINIGKKTLAGHTLTQAEVNYLEAVKRESAHVDGKPVPKFVKTQIELSEILDCDRKTIHNYRAEDKDAPKPRSDGRWSVDEWRDYLEKKGKVTKSLNKVALQAEQILLQNQRLRNKIAQDNEEWIPKAVARQVFTPLVTEAKSRSFNSVMRIVMLARAAGTTAEAVEEVRKEIAVIWQSLESSQWFNATQPVNTEGQNVST